jgi:hypothetical protein
MPRALSARFVPVAVAFLLVCISVLFFAAASTFVSADGSRETRSDILSILLR